MNLRVQLGQPAAFGTIVMSLQPGNVPILGCTWLQTAVIGNTNLFGLDAIGRYDYLIPIPATFAPLDFYFQGFLLPRTYYQAGFPKWRPPVEWDNIVVGVDATRRIGPAAHENARVFVAVGAGECTTAQGPVHVNVTVCNELRACIHVRE